MAGHAQLKFVMTECSKTQIRMTGLIYQRVHLCHFISNCIFILTVSFETSITECRVCLEYLWQIKGETSCTTHMINSSSTPYLIFNTVYTVDTDLNVDAGFALTLR